MATISKRQKRMIVFLILVVCVAWWFFVSGDAETRPRSVGIGFGGTTVPPDPQAAFVAGVAAFMVLAAAPIYFIKSQAGWIYLGSIVVILQLLWSVGHVQ